MPLPDILRLSYFKQEIFMIQEFKQFIARGNVIDMAVGIIMGAAFTAIVNSTVNDLVMPVIGIATSGMDFSNFYVPLNGEHYDTLKAAKDAGAPVMTVGLFLNAVLQFLIVSFVIFFLVKGVNKLRRDVQKEAPATVAPPEDVVLLREIRDLLKK